MIEPSATTEFTPKFTKKPVVSLAIATDNESFIFIISTRTRDIVVEYALSR